MIVSRQSEVTTDVGHSLVNADNRRLFVHGSPSLTMFLCYYINNRFLNLGLCRRDAYTMSYDDESLPFAYETHINTILCVKKKIQHQPSTYINKTVTDRQTDRQESNICPRLSHFRQSLSILLQPIIYPSALPLTPWFLNLPFPIPVERFI